MLDADTSGFTTGFQNAFGATNLLKGGMFGVAAVSAGALAAGFAKSIQVAGQFESRMSDINTLIRGDAQGAIADLSKGITELTSTLPKTADELGAAAYDVYSAGITDTTDALNTLNYSSQLSVAGLGSTKEAVDLVTTAINSYGLEASQAGAVSNILFKTVRAGKNTVAELSQNFGDLAANAAQMGVSLEEVSAATATLSASGFKASKAQTALRASIVSLMKPTGDLESIYRKLGVTTGEQLIAKSGGLVEAWGAVISQAESMGLQLSDTGIQQEAMGAITTLTDTQSEKFAETLKDAESGSNDLTEAVNEQTKTMLGLWAVLKNRVNSTFRNFGTQVLPGVREGIKLLIKFVDGLRGAFYSLMGVFAKTLQLLASGASKIAEWMGQDGLAGDLKNFAEGAKEQFDGFDEKFDDIIDQFGNLKTEGPEAFDKTETGAADLDAILNQLPGAAGSASEGVKSGAEVMEDAISQVNDKIKNTRREILGLYDEMANRTENYQQKQSSEEERYQNKVVNIVAQAKNDIKSLEDELDNARENSSQEEVNRVNRQIQQKKNILRTYNDFDIKMQDRIDERQKVLQMNELERAKYEYERKKLLMKREYLENQKNSLLKIQQKQQEVQKMISLKNKETTSVKELEKSVTQNLQEELKKRQSKIKSFVDDSIAEYERLSSSASKSMTGSSGGGLNFLPGRAKGGPVSSGQSYLVGERGPEIFTPSTFGKISPETGSKVSVTINMSNNTFMGEEDIAEKIGNDIVDTIARDNRIPRV